jgi:predicted short-subunit dehydrogenase-like oxidoreductase (DUF2520 family)
VVPPVAVFILGAGRAGRALDAALAAAGRPAVGLHGRREDDRPSAAPYGSGAIGDAARGADVVLVAVGDRELDAALGGLAGRLAPGAVVLHLSGGTEPAALAGLRAAGHPCGTFHPIVPLAGAAGAAAVLRGAYVGIDGDRRAVDCAERLAAMLGAHAVRIPPGEKARYHAAAVFASNFPVVLAAEAERLLATSGIGADDARGIVAGLLSGAAANVRALGPRDALTGPAVRGDADVVRSHVAALAGDERAVATYDVLTRAAVALAANDAGPSVLEALGRRGGGAR